MLIKESLLDKVQAYLGEENIRWFKHVKGLKGSVSAVLKLNFKRKGLPIHPIHLREGMQIRNFMRTQEECKGWTDHDYDNYWNRVVELLILRLK